jgi:hypothetical protein
MLQHISKKKSSIFLICLLCCLIASFWIFTLSSSSKTAKIPRSTSSNKKMPEKQRGGESKIDGNSFEALSNAKRKFLIISYVDDSSSASVGVLHGALGRLCYTKMHNEKQQQVENYYQSILFNDRDLDEAFNLFHFFQNRENGKIDSNNNNIRQPLPTVQDIQRANYHDIMHMKRMWSKMYLMWKVMFENNNNNNNDNTSSPIPKLNPNDWVFWVDADTLITNPEISLSDFVLEASTRNRVYSEAEEDAELKESSTSFQEIKKQLKANVEKKRRSAGGGRSGSDPIAFMQVAKASTVPDMLISNVHNGINNGVMAMRPTGWSKQFLISWWNDRNANNHAGDNGPFMHAVLRAMANHAQVPYNNECHMSRDRRMAVFSPFATCYRQFMYTHLCNNFESEEERKQQKRRPGSYDTRKCISRCPLFNKPAGSEWSSEINERSVKQRILQAAGVSSTITSQHQKRDSNSKRNNQSDIDEEEDSESIAVMKIAIDEGDLRPGFDYNFGFIIENDPHIGYSCRLNCGLGWTPVAQWLPERWLLHLAGRSKEDRNTTMQEYSKKFAGKFVKRCL